MIKDRGTMKWTSIMFPELVKNIRDAFYDEEHLVRQKPVIDEYQQSEFDELINYAMEYNYPVKFTLWINGYIEESIGYVHYVDQINKHFRLKDKNHDVVIVNMSDITDVKVLD